MGVYHLMGLGLAPGTVTGPLSYLGHRYQRWNDDDRAFFGAAGESAHRQAGERVGDVQAIVLFTTAECISGKYPDGGERLCYPYIRNAPGTSGGHLQKGDAMRRVLGGLLHEIWPRCTPRREVSLFWCEVDRRDTWATYERVARVVTALSEVGGQGKELWANLTGGNNVTNLAIQLVATLSGAVGRLYYVQAQDEQAEKCVYYTAEDGYWIHLPVMPLWLDEVRRGVLDLLTEKRSLSLDELYSRLCSRFYSAVGLQSSADLRATHLEPMWKQGLISGSESAYTVGPRWETVHPYQDVLREASESRLTMEQLSQSAGWLIHEEMRL